jgi:hypothetical protein
LQFDDDQQRHRSVVARKLQEIHTEIISMMRKTYETFRGDGNEVSESSQCRFPPTYKLHICNP